MKKFYYVLALSVLVVISFRCQKELSRNNKLPLQANNQPSPIITTLQGNVLNENGQPEAGVKISAGSKVTTTNSHGYFRITNATLDKNASFVTAEQAGYFQAYRTFTPTSGVNQVVIKLIKKNLAGSIDANTGGKITMVNGAAVLIPANGVNKISGQVYTGKINVYAAYIDPTSNDIGKTVPGSFMADDKNKKRVVLSSFGMLAVDLESSAGEKLQITPGSMATLTIPIPSANLSTAPASISLWYLDEQTGIWKEEGTAKKNGSNYIGEVKHFSYWNSDFILPAINFSVIFKTSENLPLTNMSVTVRLVDDHINGVAHGYTDSLGQLSGLIPANQELVFEVFDECYNLVYTKNIGPFIDNTDLGSIIISADAPSLTTVSGKLLSCNNTPVSKGHVIIYRENMVSYVGVNNKGEFSTSFFSCLGNSQKCEILGVDETAQQQGALLTIPLLKVTDVGDINACGISSVQFINYTLDGTDYSISSSANDSLAGYSIGGLNAIATYIQGHHSSNNFLNFYFTGSAQNGIYPLNLSAIINYNRIAPSMPFEVSITAFPQKTGEFYEGNFSGSFIDSSALSVTHNINCSFRIKKY